MNFEFYSGRLLEFFAEKEYARATRDLYRHYLMAFLTWLESEGLDFETLAGVKVKIWLEGHATWGDTARYQTVAAIRGFARFLFGQAHPLGTLRVKKPILKPHRVLNERQLGALMDRLADPDEEQPQIKITNIRNLAMVALLADTGLRAGETCRLELARLDLESLSLQVIAKGGQWKTCVFSRETADLLIAWLELRKKYAVKNCPFVFIGIWGNRPGEGMSRDGLRAVFRRFAQHAGFETLSPHDLRRTFATLSLRHGASTRLVQMQGGWSNLAMLMHYSRYLEAGDFQPFSPVAHLKRRRAGKPKPSQDGIISEE